jgi:hypothetical protein
VHSQAVLLHDKVWMYAVRLVEHWLSHIEQTFSNKVMLDAIKGATGCKQLTHELTAVEPAEPKI